MDFVSEESEIAGKYAAEYVLNGSIKKDVVDIINGKNISYVVPQKLNKNMSGNVKLFFRATNTFRDCTIIVKCGETVLLKRKKKIIVPGEMETLLLTDAKIAETNGEIIVTLEEEV